jgi:hypothetical protein
MDLSEAAVGREDQNAFGRLAKRKRFLAVGAVTSATTKFQVPTIWSFRLCAGCAAAVPADKASVSKAVAVRSVMVSFPVCWRASYSGTHRCTMQQRSPDERSDIRD